MLGIFANVMKTATRQDHWAGDHDTTLPRMNQFEHERRKSAEMRRQLEDIRARSRW